MTERSILLTVENLRTLSMVEDALAEGQMNCAGSSDPDAAPDTVWAEPLRRLRLMKEAAGLINAEYSQRDVPYGYEVHQGGSEHGHGWFYTPSIVDQKFYPGRETAVRMAWIAAGYWPTPVPGDPEEKPAL